MVGHICTVVIVGMYAHLLFCRCIKYNLCVSFAGPRFSGPGYPGEFPPQGGPLPDYPVEDYEESGFGEYSTRQDFPDSDMDMRPFSDGMGHHPVRSGLDGLGPGGGRDGYGRSGQLEESSGRMYPDEYRVGPMGSSSMDRPMDKPMERPGLMGAAPESRNPPSALLSYLVCVSFLSMFLPNL